MKEYPIDWNWHFMSMNDRYETLLAHQRQLLSTMDRADQDVYEAHLCKLILGDNMTIDYLQAKLDSAICVRNQADKDIARIEGEIEERDKAKVGVPEIGDWYYDISVTGTVSETQWDNDSYDNSALEIGNAFLTEEDAENEVARRKISTKIKRRIAELNDGWEHDGINSYSLLYISQGFGVERVLCTEHHGSSFVEQWKMLKSTDYARTIINEFTVEELKLGLFT